MLFWHLRHRLVADKALPTVRNKAEFHARETEVGVLTLGPVVRDGARSVRVLSEYEVNGVSRVRR